MLDSGSLFITILAKWNSLADVYGINLQYLQLEKLCVGWTGDTQVFSMTAAFNYNVATFYTKWLADLRVDQQPNGEVPNIIPDMWNNKLGGTIGWGDAAVIVPWTVYQSYGDKRNVFSFAKHNRQYKMVFLIVKCRFN